MIESLPSARPDRLSAFFQTFDLSVTLIPSHAEDAAANLLVMGRSDENAEAIHFCARGNTEPRPSCGVMVAAAVQFGGLLNPLMNAMPERLVVALDEVPTLRAVTVAFVTEASHSRCGRSVALDRLCEVIVLLVFRRAIDLGTTGPGLLAGLSHPALHRAIVAIHDQPSQPWRIEDLAEISGMSRSRFMTVFPKVVGATPAAYLTSWRLTLGCRELSRGGRVKSVAQRVGFGSAAAFSRAYSRAYGHPPVAMRDARSHS